MELANCLIAIAGDRGNTVPKYSVTAAEIAVLRAVHGDQAVFDIVPVGKDDSINNGAEYARLRETYRARDEDGQPIILSVYPSPYTPLHRSLADLGLGDDAFAAKERFTAADVPAEGAEPKRGRAKGGVLE